MTDRRLLLPCVSLLLSAGLAAQEPAGMEPFTLALEGTTVEIPMVPIPVGKDGYPATFKMGSPADEAGRKDDEGPQVEIEVAPFWMGKFEVSWDAFDEFRRAYSAHVEGALRAVDVTEEVWADAVSLPTPLYEQDAAPILKGMGTKGGFPVANVSQFAARQFTKWLSRKTGQFYRLPTEAEWEYAARAGTTTAYSFGDDPEQLGEHAVFFENSLYDDVTKGHPDFGAGYRKSGSKAPNPWGLHDMHGNVAEWVIDQYAADAYSRIEGGKGSVTDAIVWPTKVFPCVARGGSWDSEPDACRSAARLGSDAMWQDRDPQFPKSIWWFTDGFHVGFRIVRPLNAPSPEDQLRYWESADDATNGIIRAGGKEVRAKVGDGQ
ncbi:MAG: formylglycine-generating enzyme family protein [Planctomycetota bacterium]